MPVPGEHKTVQARILAYAQEIGWCYVSRAEAEKRRGFDPDGITTEDRARPASLYFGDLLYTKIREFNPKYKETEGALIGEFRRLNADIAGNRDFLNYLRNQGKFFCAAENRELDLVLIDYANPDRNVYEVTEEFYVHNLAPNEMLVPYEIMEKEFFALAEIVHELLHFSVPNHGRLWKSLMRAHLGDHEALHQRLQKAGGSA